MSKENEIDFIVQKNYSRKPMIYVAGQKMFNQKNERFPPPLIHKQKMLT